MNSQVTEAAILTAGPLASAVVGSYVTYKVAQWKSAAETQQVESAHEVEEDKTSLEADRDAVTAWADLAREYREDHQNVLSQLVTLQGTVSALQTEVADLKASRKIDGAWIELARAYIAELIRVLEEHQVPVPTPPLALGLRG